MNFTANFPSCTQSYPSILKYLLFDQLSWKTWQSFWMASILYVLLEV